MTTGSTSPARCAPSPPPSRMSAHAPPPLSDDLWTEATEEREEVGVGGLPSEAQLVLLCLDYLRDLRRAYSPQDLRDAEGLNADSITLAIYALKRAFLKPAHLTTCNDAHFHLEGDTWNSGHDDFRKNSVASMEQEFLYRENPDEESKQDSKQAEVDESYTWYEYDDTHPSNSHRFYPLNGLASGPNLRGPLTLGEIAAAGLATLEARSRQDAERDMVKSPLFDQFVQAVTAKGFFSAPPDENHKHPVSANKDTLYEERYAKVVAKFRTKLANKAQAANGNGTAMFSPLSPTMSIGSPVNNGNISANLVALSAVDRHQKRRERRMEMARLKRREQTDTSIPTGVTPPRRPEETRSKSPLVTSLAKKLAPPSKTTATSNQSDSEEGTTASSAVNPVDLEEAEKLKAKGNAHMQRKEYEEAAEAYTAALKLSPAGPSSHVYFSNRAAALLSQKRFEEAILDSERSLALKPDYGKAHARLGLAHFLLGNYRPALEAYTVSLKYDPDNKSSRNYLEKAAKRLAAEGDKGNKSAGMCFSIVSEWDKSDQNHQSSTKTKVTEDAEEHKRLVDSREAEKFKGKGNSYMASREYQLAVDAYTHALRLCPNGPQSHVYYSNRAAALCYLERYEEAEMDSEKSLELNPTYGKAHARLGLSRFFLGDYQGAVSAYTAALEYDPDNAASKSYLQKAKAKLSSSESSTTTTTRLTEKEQATSDGCLTDAKVTRAVTPPKSSDTLANARRLMENPQMQKMAKKAMEDPSLRLLDDPEMNTMAKKAMSDPSMREAMMAQMNNRK